MSAMRRVDRHSPLVCNLDAIDRGAPKPVSIVGARVSAEAAADDWQRPIPQFQQPHNFLGLGQRILRERAPDVYQAVLKTGASEKGSPDSSPTNPALMA